MKFAKVACINALALTVVLLLGVGVTQSAQAQTYRVLYTFKGGKDGELPYAGLVRDAKGNLYGTTFAGGTGSGCVYGGCGTVFKLTKNGKETLLHSFIGVEGDGAEPLAGLIRDKSGNLYGTTSKGGAFGFGMIFKLDTTGAETVLYSFAGGTDGNFPFAGLVMDKAGNLYGTTYEGGGTNYGTVFKLNKNGKETVLYSFRGNPDGEYPVAGLVRDATGNLYGTTEGGASGFGMVFKLDTAGTETVLYSFTGYPGDGQYPQAGLVQDTAGNLYGTTVEGGASGPGAVFKVDTSGTETLLHSFTGGSDGAYPYAGLVRDAVGKFYGDTNKGGAANIGTVFKVSKTGRETVLHSFNPADGAYPEGGLVRDDKGHFYGTAFEGGDSSCNAPYGCGTVFKLTPQ